MIKRSNAKKVANWVRTNLRKEDIMRILFSDEKSFDVDVIYNSQNNQMWAVDRADANEKGWPSTETKIPITSNESVGCLFQGDNTFCYLGWRNSRSYCLHRKNASCRIEIWESSFR